MINKIFTYFYISTLEQNDNYFADDINKRIFCYDNLIFIHWNLFPRFWLQNVAI